MLNNNYKFFLYTIVIIFLPSHITADSSAIINNLKAEPGFSIEIFIDDIDTPRQIAESDAGNIFVGSRKGGKIISIDIDKNVRILAEGLSNSTGVTFHEGDLYFS